MKAAYLAGPMRGKEYLNAPAFAAAAAKLRLSGFHVISPPEEDLAAGEAYLMSAEPDQVFTEKSLARVILRDCGIICHDIDTLALLPGWAKSKGARVEFALSEFMSRDVINSTGERESLAEFKRTLAMQLLREAVILEIEEKQALTDKAGTV